MFIRCFTDVRDAFTERMRLCHALAELFQEAMAALQNALEESLPVDLRNYFHGGQPFSGMGDVRTQPFRIVGKNLDALPSPRDRNVKLLAVDGGERFLRGDQQHIIHGLAF